MRISLLIPTRERAEFLRACLATVTAIADPDLEIIVSDNASTDGTEAIVRAAADTRIRLVNPGRRVSQRRNFEFALAHSIGDYVMAIGDDDAVLPAQWSRLRAILAGHQPYALTWPALFYHWPGPEKHGGGGRLRLQRALLNGNPVMRSSAEQQRALGRLERSREDFSPKLYHGMLARRTIEALRARTGEVLMSGQIDAYIALAALNVIPDYLYIRHPFTILAMGPQSGGSSVAAQHRAGDPNANARRVAEEAEGDPVAEPMPMPYPVLGIYLLNGLEQARRKAWDGAFPLDYPAYFRMIGDQLEAVGAEARARGLALLEALAQEVPDRDGVLGALASIRARLASIALPRETRPKLGFIRRIESLSMLEPSRITLDLKSRGLAAVDGAARMADWLIGPADSGLIGGSESGLIGFPETGSIKPDNAKALWRCTCWRAAQAILGKMPD